jgi:hypothetical protein
MEGNAPKITLVIGMHRSGTSLCANMIHRLGADMAEEGFNPGKSNPRGHWERPALVHINDRIFDIFRRHWGSPAHILSMPDAYLDNPRVQSLHREAVDWIRPHLQGATPFGFKDPRTTLLLPFWQRDPAQVARSLLARDKLDLGQAEYRWLRYTIAAITHIADAALCIIPYETWFETPLDQAARLATFLDLPCPAQDTIQAVLTADLRHDDPAAKPASRTALRLHQAIAENAGQPVLHPALRSLAAELDDFCAAIQPLLIGVEIMRVNLREHAQVIANLQAHISRLQAPIHVQ